MTYSRIKGLVSVVIPNYNRAAYLQECLNGILQQTYTNWEIILIDDGSTDDSIQQTQAWLLDNRINLPNHNSIFTMALPRNIGYAGAMTIGFYMAKGEYIAIQDSDDISHLQRLEKQINFLEAHQNIELLGTNYHVFEHDPNEVVTIPKWLRYGEHIRTTYRKGGHCVCHGTIMMRGALFDRIGGHTRRVKGAEDYDFIARSLDPNHLNIENIPDVLYYYRSHPKQRSRKYFSKKQDPTNES
ncbi:glycosyltransferase [Paenibacillus sp. MER 180]|uniref:glycosyltransferase family 2 protein n=1 Tax=Paenibacillus sp. MER 180 TaxID=2939570 RepID=UPI00203E8D0C|nr:glycosyltransferase family 2 protein [Paenibacillus sp. MER 180]MCM3290433.1 glycosyltransferase [Paenibacillus sp. MER 180]